MAHSLPPMMTATKFEQTIKAKLVENKLAGKKPDSIRGLSRVMAKGNETLSESYRTSLLRWMRPDGPTPSAGNRALIEVSLDLERGSLDQSDDDEESDSVTFGDAMQRMFDRAVDRAFEDRMHDLESRFEELLTR